MKFALPEHLLMHYATALRLRASERAAVRLVVLNGLTHKAAADRTGLDQEGVTGLVDRVRRRARRDQALPAQAVLASTMTPAEFRTATTGLRIDMPGVKAARRILVDGLSVTEAAHLHGCSRQAAYINARRIRARLAEARHEAHEVNAAASERTKGIETVQLQVPVQLVSAVEDLISRWSNGRSDSRRTKGT